MTETHHVKIAKSSGTYKGFTLLSPRHEIVQDVSAFAQKVSSGPQGMGDLTTYAADGQDDWSHGFGIDRQWDRLGYEHATGNIDTRHGVITAFTRSREIAAPSDGFGTLVRVADFDSVAYIATTTGLYTYDSTADTVTRILGGRINALFNEGDYLLVAPYLRRTKGLTTAAGTLPTTLTAVTAGGGTVTIPNNIACRCLTSTVAKAAFVYTTTALGATKLWHIPIRWRAASIVTSSYEYPLQITDKATAPAADSIGTSVLQVYQAQSDGDIWLVYVDNSSVPQYWTGTAWSATPGDIGSGTVGATYEVILETNGTSWYFALYDADGTLITQTGAVTWALTKAIANSLWLVCGDYATDAAGGDLYLENIQVFDSTQTTCSVDGDFGGLGDATIYPPEDVGGFAMYGGYIWFWDRNTNRLHYTSTPHLDMDGGTEPLYMPIGPGDVHIQNVVGYKALYIFREDGIWTLYQVGDKWQSAQVCNYKWEQSSANFTAVCTWRGFMFYDINGRFVRFNNDMEFENTPPATGTTWPKTEYGDVICAFAKGDYLYVIAYNGAEYALMAYDGAYWNYLSQLTTTGTWAGGLSYSVLKSRMFYGLTDSGGTNHVYYIKFNATSEHVYADFSAGTTGVVYSTILDSGFPYVPKSYDSVKVESTGCGANDYVLVEYAIDANIAAGTFTPITGDAVTSRVNTSPVQMLEFGAAITGYQIQYRLTLTLTSTTATPTIVKAITAYILRPPTVRMWTVTIPLHGETRNRVGGTDNETVSALETFLWECRAEVPPLTYTDWLGNTHTVYMNGLRITTTETALETMLQGKVAQISLIEAET